MNTHELNSGGGAIVRNMLDVEQARAIGSAIRSKIDAFQIPPIWSKFDLAYESQQRNGFVPSSYRAATERVAAITKDVFDPAMLDISAIYTRNNLSRFYFHVDMDSDGDNPQAPLDIRTIINVSDGDTTFSTLPSDRAIDLDSEGWVKLDDYDEPGLVHTLHPGDGYIINNLSVPSRRIAHATPERSKGRTTLRFDQFVACGVTATKLYLPDQVEIELLSEGISLEPSPLRVG